MRAGRLVLAGLLALAAPLVFVVPAPAQEEPTAAGLSLLEAARLAFEGHPSVMAADARREAAGSARREAAAAWLPDVVLDADYTRFEEPMLVTPLHAFDLTQRPVFDRDIVQVTVASRWTVFDGGERSGRIGRAAALEDAADADLDDVRARLLAEVTSTYLGVLALRETLGAHDGRLEALQEERDRVQLAVREEKLARVEGSRVDAALASGRADRVAAAESLDVAVRDLARLIGHKEPPDPEGLARSLVAPAPAALDLPERTETDSLRGLSDSLLAHAEPPAVRRARSEAAAAEAARRAQAGTWFPDLRLASGYVERGALDRSYTGEWQVGIELEYPLFSGGARRAAVSRAEAERRAAEERVRIAEDGTGARIDRALAALESARSRAAALAQAVASRDEVARIERLRVQVGSGVESDYLDALADLLEARATEVRARHAILEAEVEFARATGVLDLGWLERRLEAAP